MGYVKLRAWDNVKSEMYYTGEEDLIMFTFDSSGVVAEEIIEDNSEDGFHVEKLEHLKYMQFTGLYDNKNNEIYEGDIVSDHVGVGVVEYYHSGFRVNYNDGYCKWLFDYLVSEYRTIEVNGNIYENKELLK